MTDIKDKEYMLPTHSCKSCRKDFICSFITNGHCCKCLHLSKTDKNNVFTHLYFCDYWCYNEFLGDHTVIGKEVKDELWDELIKDLKGADPLPSEEEKKLILKRTD